MPPMSKTAIKDQLFKALAELPDFDLTVDELEEFLSQTSFDTGKSGKKHSTHKTSAYQCYLKSSPTGEDGTVLKLEDRRIQWKIVKADPQQLKVFQEQADEINSSKSSNFELQKEILFKNLEIRTIKSKIDDVLSVQLH